MSKKNVEKKKMTKEKELEFDRDFDEWLAEQVEKGGYPT